MDSSSRHTCRLDAGVPAPAPSLTPTLTLDSDCRNVGHAIAIVDSVQPAGLVTDTDTAMDMRCIQGRGRTRPASSHPALAHTQPTDHTHTHTHTVQFQIQIPQYRTRTRTPGSYRTREDAVQLSPGRRSRIYHTYCRCWRRVELVWLSGLSARGGVGEAGVGWGRWGVPAGRDVPILVCFWFRSACVEWRAYCTCGVNDACAVSTDCTHSYVRPFVRSQPIDRSSSRLRLRARVLHESTDTSPYLLTCLCTFEMYASGSIVTRVSSYRRNACQAQTTERADVL